MAGFLHEVLYAGAWLCLGVLIVAALFLRLSWQYDKSQVALMLSATTLTVLVVLTGALFWAAGAVL